MLVGNISRKAILSGYFTWPLSGYLARSRPRNDSPARCGLRRVLENNTSRPSSPALDQPKKAVSTSALLGLLPHPIPPHCHAYALSCALRGCQTSVRLGAQPFIPSSPSSPLSTLVASPRVAMRTPCLRDFNTPGSTTCSYSPSSPYHSSFRPRLINITTPPHAHSEPLSLSGGAGSSHNSHPLRDLDLVLRSKQRRLAPQCTLRTSRASTRSGKQQPGSSSHATTSSFKLHLHLTSHDA